MHHKEQLRGKVQNAYDTPCTSLLADTPKSFNLVLLRDAQAHLERAKTLDSENEVASGLLERVPSCHISELGFDLLISGSVIAVDDEKPTTGI